MPYLVSYLISFLSPVPKGSHTRLAFSTVGTVLNITNLLGFTRLDRLYAFPFYAREYFHSCRDRNREQNIEQEMIALGSTTLLDSRTAESNGDMPLMLIQIMLYHQSMTPDRNAMVQGVNNIGISRFPHGS